MYEQASVQFLFVNSVLSEYLKSFFADLTVIVLLSVPIEVISSCHLLCAEAQNVLPNLGAMRSFFHSTVSGP